MPEMVTTAERPYLPAMGDPRLLPLYDGFTRLLGARPVQWRLVAQAGLAPGQTVLEIGAGTGTVLLLAKEAVPGATVIGIDPDPDALAAAGHRAARAGVELRLDHGYADALPYADGSVDRILSSFMFHHIPPDQKAAALAEAHRVLAPGGSLHIADIGGEPPGRIGRLLHGSHDHHHAHDAGRPAPTPADELIELLRAAGFTEAGVVGRARIAVGSVTFTRAER